MNIKAKRLEKGITLEVLSDKTGINKGRLSEIEREKYNPTVETLQRIADALDCELIILLK